MYQSFASQNGAVVVNSLVWFGILFLILEEITP